MNGRDDRVLREVGHAGLEFGAQDGSLLFQHGGEEVLQVLERAEVSTDLSAEDAQRPGMTPEAAWVRSAIKERFERFRPDSLGFLHDDLSSKKKDPPSRGSSPL